MLKTAFCFLFVFLGYVSMEPVESESLKHRLTVLEKNENATKKEINQLKVNEDASKMEINQLKVKVQELIELQGQSTPLNRDKRAAYVPGVAFSASLATTGRVTVSGGGKTVIFKHVFTNFANAYNKDTGIFTAPVGGVYHFTFTTYGYTQHYTSGAFLVKNGHLQVSTYVFHDRVKSGLSSGSTSGTVILQLNDGDMVQIALWHAVYDDRYHHTTFSGFLLFQV